MGKSKKYIAILFLGAFTFYAYAFNSGFVLGLKANLTGSLSLPHIKPHDMELLGANHLDGSLGYITTGEVDVSYLFDSVRYFRLQNNSVFGGLGWGFALGLGQGFTGQISGQLDTEVLHKQIDLYCRIHMTPVLTFTTGLRSYFLRNRLSLGGNIGIKIPLDPQPVYEVYTNLTPEEVNILKKATKGAIDFSNETGTLLITNDQIKKINPVGFVMKGFLEYNQPFLDNMEIVMGVFLSYAVYRPKYVTMPQKLVTAAQVNAKRKDPNSKFNLLDTPINSLYLNSLDFGVSIGLTFKV